MTTISICSHMAEVITRLKLSSLTRHHLYILALIRFKRKNTGNCFIDWTYMAGKDL